MSATTQLGPVELWDSVLLEHCVIDELLSRERHPLATAEAPDAPGVYLVFYGRPASTTGGSPYASIQGATFPLYVGAARNLRSRLRSHQLRVAPVKSLHGGKDLHVVAMALPSCAEALYAEQLVRERLRPVWIETWCTGFGSKDQGATRRTQTPPAWSVLHPARIEGTGGVKITSGELARRVKDHLAVTAVVELWPSLDTP